ncbi:MAG: TonB-dependent receptor [Bacteroidales bacterium]|jgi:TonB-linked SusC/RagA family outer membrane protein|nr:TonB-dependent receptor [Bacteroidales bacterium]
MKCFKKKVHLLLGLLLLPAIAFAQIAITGTVTDANDEPVIGANVIETGTRNSAVTDVNGNFSLTVANNAVLQVSCLGYVAREISVSSAVNGYLAITLAEDTKALEEVVVIGYGTVKKSDLTGSVASVSDKQFKNQPVKQISEVLQGRMAGVEVTNTSGVLGAGAKIRIRGTSSVHRSNDPLYVVDGIVRTTGLAGINPADIASIEVLKDASATAIYGSRGSNGVILITTKRGKTGKPLITVEADWGLSSVIKKYEVMNAYEYAQALNDLRGSTTISAADMEAYKNGTKGINWQDIMFQTGFSQDYKVGISGGNNSTRYLVSGNVLDQKGVSITSKYRRYQVRANLDTDVTRWLTLAADLNVAQTSVHNPDIDLRSTVAYSPTIEMKDPETGVYKKDPYNTVTNNPYGARVETEEDNPAYLANGNIELRFNILDGLTLSVKGGLDFIYSGSYGFASERRFDNAQSTMYNSMNRQLNWQNVNNLTYSKKIGDHNFTVTAVWEMSKYEYNYLAANGTNLQTESVGYWNIANAETYVAANGYSAEQMLSGVGRLMYGYKGRYLFTGTFRADGSSKFQGDNKWGYFPSGAVAWNVSEEDFMKNQHIFQKLKVRASAGITGNQAIDRYSTLGGLSTKAYSFGTGTLYTGYTAIGLSTPDVRWESNYQYDIGVDFSVLDGKLNFTADWFLKQTRDMLLVKSVPYYNGGGGFWVNEGKINNTGWDFSIDALPITDKDLTWESVLTVSFLKNEVIDIGDDPYLLSNSSNTSVTGPTSIVIPGKPVGSFYVFDWVGFNRTGANFFRTADGSLSTEPMPEDKIISGQVNPKWSFGWNNTINWKNWEANIFIHAATGFNRLNLTRFRTASMVGEMRFISLRDAYFRSWDNVENKADALYPSHKNLLNKYYGDSSMWLEDASYVKIRNISIAYLIPRKVLKFADIRISISAQNVLTLTKYKGMDPEAYNDVEGRDDGAYPVPRTFTLGIKASF